MAQVRNRTRTGQSRQGYYLKPTGSITYYNWNDFQWSCEDVVGNKGANNAFLLEKHTIYDMITMTGSHNGQIYVNYPPTNVGVGAAHLSLPSRPSNAQLAIDATARSNPSKPMVDLPVFIWELADLPKLLKYTGDLLLKPKSQSTRDAISGLVNDPKNVDVYLAWEFGWAPLISDTLKLLNFVSNTEKRLKEIQGLYKNGGLRRRIQFQTQRASLVQPNLQVQSAGGFSVYVDRSINTFRESWATVRWIPDVPQFPSDSELLSKAIRSAHGLNLSIASTWEAMPWSWLIDYFTHVGSYVETNRNAIGAHPGEVCIMVHTQTDQISRLRSKSAPNVVVTGSGRYTRDNKERYVVSPGTPAGLVRVPFLSGKQWSILSSLAISKNKSVARR